VPESTGRDLSSPCHSSLPCPRRFLKRGTCMALSSRSPAHNSTPGAAAHKKTAQWHGVESLRELRGYGKQPGGQEHFTSNAVPFGVCLPRVTKSSISGLAQKGRGGTTKAQGERGARAATGALFVCGGTACCPRAGQSPWNQPRCGAKCIECASGFSPTEVAPLAHGRALEAVPVVPHMAPARHPGECRLKNRL
jgi:hypothetical protein